MKIKLLLITCLTIVSLSAWSQKQGFVNYDLIIDLHANLSKDQQAFKSMIPQYQTTKKALYFNEKHAKLENVKDTEQNGGNIQVAFIGGGEETIFDFEMKKIFRFSELSGKKYLVEMPLLENKNIKFITGESKNILGYQCKKAIYTTAIVNADGVENEEVYTVWYTDADGLKGSPTTELNIPGLILHMKSDKSEYKATAVKLKSIESKKFDIPEGYKKITNDQFLDLQEEMIDELRSNTGIKN